MRAFKQNPQASRKAFPRVSPRPERADFNGGLRHQATSSCSQRIPVTQYTDEQILPKLSVNKPGDKHEQEADRIADQVMRMPEPRIQRACACGGACPDCQTEQPELDDTVIQTMRGQAGDTRHATVPPSVQKLSTSHGQPIDAKARGYMESRFSRDFSEVRVHTDNSAVEMNDALGARAFTYGSNIYFNRGEYTTASAEGRRLLAHELTHVVQQHRGDLQPKIQRSCSDPAFCTPYTSATEISEARDYLLNSFIPVLETFFGSDVGGLWRRYLSRRPGDSLTPVVFNRAGNSIHDAFSTSSAIAEETDNVLDLVASRLSRGYGNVTQPITNFLSNSEMELNTRFGNPFTIPGNIAGGIGSSDAGPDSRRIPVPR